MSKFIATPHRKSIALVAHDNKKADLLASIHSAPSGVGVGNGRSRIGRT